VDPGYDWLAAIGQRRFTRGSDNNSTMQNPIGESYRGHLLNVVATSAGPHGYTLTLWTAGAVTSHAEKGPPDAPHAILLLAGAVLGFLTVGTVATGNINAVIQAPPRRMRVWGAAHLPAVMCSIGLCALFTRSLQGGPLWAGVGYASTVTYLVVSALQSRLAAERPARPSATAPAAGLEDRRRNNKAAERRNQQAVSGLDHRVADWPGYGV
jgi:hypothetical protein